MGALGYRTQEGQQSMKNPIECVFSSNFPSLREKCIV